MKLITALVGLFLFATAAFALRGVDISQATSAAAFQCLKRDGYDFVVIRGYESVGRIDPNVATSASHAASAGVAVDVYIFPCQRCGNAAGQMTTLVNYLHSHGVRFGTIWLDIEGPGTYWSANHASNTEFIKELLDHGRSLGAHVGVYTSKSQWIPITGGATVASTAPLWYAHYDGTQNFGDFSPFGGWTHPYMKQYKGTTSLCGTGVDENWRP
eukprot:TRINITY_DN430_c0_g1_i1.p1 TRINITY_DN430_c0_g1~~TRINITY_DN430_c0_g1_i1.p1  ORF type:complete len:214 (-),score=44.97 TRINITY_DN430_c0_g1_i1:55-696(-)